MPFIVDNAYISSYSLIQYEYTVKFKHFKCFLVPNYYKSHGFTDLTQSQPLFHYSFLTAPAVV